ncbi:MAG: DNA primase [Bacilli bacterium]|nr:DNA primase [Bacilli bacterium]
MNEVKKLDYDTINNIKNSVDIVDVISSYIPLTSKGKNLFGVCPFHDDTNPSMSVSREKQIYTCFSCGATGTVFTFLQDYEHISFIEAVKMCADKSGIPLNIRGIKEQNKNNKLYDIYEIATKLYQNNINTNHGLEAKKYLKERKIDDDIIKEFKIGLALNDNKLSRLLLKKEYDEKLLEKSGLIGKNGINIFDSFYDRIIFPIEDSSGKVVGFSGRIYKKYLDNTPSKYKNTKETEIFKKGEILYNYSRAKEEARKRGIVIIMEGFMDLFRAYSVGIKNVVVSMGTAVTKEQALLLKRIAKDIILCFDGDKAGEKATYSCSNELIALGITPKIVRLEENLDPDEYILKYGKDKFLNKINNPISVMDFKMHYLKENKDLNNSIDMSNYINQVIDELNKIDDDILREITIKKISNESNIDPNLIKNKLENKKETKVKIEKKEEIKTNMYIKAEQYLLYYMLNNVEVIKMYQNQIGYMPTDKYRKLAFEINYFYKKNGYINISDLMISLNENEELINIIKEINLLNLKDEYSKEQITDYINSIKRYNIKFESKRLKDLMRMELDPVKKAEYAEKILEINKLNNEIGE